MTFQRREQNGPFPSPAVLLSVPERHHECTCTWVTAVYSKDGKSLLALKYPSGSCPAATFHRRLASGQLPGILEPS